MKEIKDPKEAERILNDFIVKVQIAFKINRKEAIKIILDYKYRGVFK